MVNFGPLTAEISSGVWGTPANFNGFCVLLKVLSDAYSAADAGDVTLLSIHGFAAPAKGAQQPPSFWPMSIVATVAHLS